MRICQHHWKMLRQAIADRGLEHLGARSGQEAALALVTELEGRGAENEFDLLMCCNNMIWTRGLESGGLYLMGQKKDGSEYCPVCEALDHVAPPPGMTAEDCERWWIDGPADAALARSRKKGLVPRSTHSR